MIPPARDPRMDRPEGDDDGAGQGWLVSVAPVTDARPPTRVDPDQLAPAGRGAPGWLWGVLVVLVTGVVGLAPRAIAYPSLMDENLALRERLTAVDRRLGEADHLMERLRTYEARIRSVIEAQGDHGPLPDDIFTNGSLLQAYGSLSDDASDPAPGGGEPVQADDLRPAQVWARGVTGRMDAYFEAFADGEDDLEALLRELESVRRIRSALPQVWPTSGQITSGYGYRSDPVHGRTKFHSGLDIANGRGTPVYAAAPGTVVKAGTSSGYGRVVEIDHGFGITTKYAHNTTLRVREGEKVEAGDYIATMGSTGKSTGPHVHFELRLDGNAVDPLPYLPRGGPPSD